MAMSLSNHAAPVSILGGPAQSGAYVLQIDVTEPLAVRFGRFDGGRPVALRPGSFLYAGSAMGQRGSSSLAHRLLRHATCGNGRPPHAIRPALLAALRAAGLGPETFHPPATKTAHWHIDYLLDEPAAALSRVVIVRTAHTGERALVEWLAAQPATAPVSPGLGASDHPGHTHLLAAVCTDSLWEALLDHAAFLSRQA